MKDGELLLLVDVPSGGNQFVATWDLYLWDSTDGGKTWINERKLDAKKVGGGCIVPSRIAELKDGTDTFGQYQNVGITAGHVLHFLAAHYVVGDPEPADKILRAMRE